jgi:hypothetical protein
MEVKQTTRKEGLELDAYFTKRSQTLGPAPSDKDSVTIQPLFHFFGRLPPEIQEMIFMKAAGLSRAYNLRSDDYGTLRAKKDPTRRAISLSTMFKISKRMNEHLLPFILHSTDFQFGLTGYADSTPSFSILLINTRFTNFLWQSGPSNRHEIRRLTFHFGKLALLHCIRWLAHDSIFALLEPPVATNPRSLQYFWRCQIQDLVKDLHLFTLTINIKEIPMADVLMIAAIIKSAFGSVERICFIETDSDGKTCNVDRSDERLRGLMGKSTWKEMCAQYYQNHRINLYYFKSELLKGQAEDLESAMSKEKEFFDEEVAPLFAGSK